MQTLVLPCSSAQRPLRHDLLRQRQALRPDFFPVSFDHPETFYARFPHSFPAPAIYSGEVIFCAACAASGDRRLLLAPQAAASGALAGLRACGSARHSPRCCRFSSSFPHADCPSAAHAGAAGGPSVPCPVRRPRRVPAGPADRPARRLSRRGGRRDGAATAPVHFQRQRPSAPCASATIPGRLFCRTHRELPCSETCAVG